MVKDDDLNPPQVGDRVRIAWGLDVLDGTVLDVTKEARGRAVVQVDLPGASEEEGEVTVSLPLAALQPADWWPDSSEPTGGWVSHASYERHVLEAIGRAIPEESRWKVHQASHKEGYDFFIDTPRGLIIFEAKYFRSRTRTSPATVRSLAHKVRRIVGNIRTQTMFVVVVNDRPVGAAIERQFSEDFSVHVIVWKSRDDDQKLRQLMESWL